MDKTGTSDMVKRSKGIGGLAMGEQKKMQKTTQRLCKRCKYGSGSVAQYKVYCNYLVDTGNRRGCPVGYCDKYETTTGRKWNRLDVRKTGERKKWEKKMIEKYYIVTNQKYLQGREAYYKAEKERRALINEFFDKHGIESEHYLLFGNGLVNSSFTDLDKRDIKLRIDDTNKTREKFKEHLKKGAFHQNMAEFKKNSTIMKELQEECVSRGIVINNHSPKPRDFFYEIRYIGYSYQEFEHRGTLYLKVVIDREASLTLNPGEEGFTEIKGSEYHAALEELEASE